MPACFAYYIRVFTETQNGAEPPRRGRGAKAGALDAPGRMVYNRRNSRFRGESVCRGGVGIGSEAGFPGVKFRLNLVRRIMKKNESPFRFPTVRYVKRLRMSIELPGRAETERNVPELPRGFVWLPWHPCLTDTHGEVKFQAFHRSFDADVFPTFRSRQACIALMRSIAGHSGFVPQATWMIACRSADSTLPIPVNPRNEYELRSRKPETEHLDYVATIQGIRTSPGVAAIQNVAVRPEFRGRGLGRALLMKALDGFRTAGIGRVTLEATSGNTAAIRLYETSGFRLYQTLYKEVYVS